MKKTIILFLISFIALSCASLSILSKKPEVSVKKFDIESISLKDVTFRFDIELTNPYPIAFKLDDIGFNVKVEDHQFLKTRTKKGVTVSAGGSEITPVTIKLEYEPIMRIIKDYSNKDYLECMIDMDIVIPLPEMLHSIKKNITFDYTVKKKVPALKPSVKISSVKIDAPSLDTIKEKLLATKKDVSPENVFKMFNDLISGSRLSDIGILKSVDFPITISFDIEVQNNTRASIYFTSMAYEFIINGERLIRGETRNIKNTNGRSIIQVTNRFSSMSLGSSVLKMFTSRQAQYQLTGYSFIKLPDEIKSDPLKLDFGDKGEFHLK